MPVVPNQPQSSNSVADLTGVGELRTLQSLEGSPIIVERLKEMGLYPGLEIIYLGRAPFKGPHLIRLGSVVLALRQEEAQCILLSR